jgi:hypothetical protein
LTGKVAIAHAIPCRPIAMEMLLSVNLNGNSRLEAGEIEHIRAPRNLAAKMKALLAQQP